MDKTKSCGNTEANHTCWKCRLKTAEDSIIVIENSCTDFVHPPSEDDLYTPKYTRKELRKLKLYITKEGSATYVGYLDHKYPISFNPNRVSNMIAFNFGFVVDVESMPTTILLPDTKVPEIEPIDISNKNTGVDFKYKNISSETVMTNTIELYFKWTGKKTNLDDVTKVTNL